MDDSFLELAVIFVVGFALGMRFLKSHSPSLVPLEAVSKPPSPLVTKATILIGVALLIAVVFWDSLNNKPWERCSNLSPSEYAQRCM